MKIPSEIKEAIKDIVRENDNDPEVIGEWWKEAVEEYFHEKAEEFERYTDWTEDARTYGCESVGSVLVSVKSHSRETGEPMDSTDFWLNREEAESMFFGIRDRYKGVEFHV